MQQLHKQQIGTSRPFAARPAPRVLPSRSVRTHAATMDKQASSATGQPHGRIFNFSAGPANLPIEVRDPLHPLLGAALQQLSTRMNRFQCRKSPFLLVAGMPECQADFCALSVSSRLRFRSAPEHVHGHNTSPPQVLEEAQADLINYKGNGMSVMEMSHRGKEFMGIAAKAEEDLRKLLGIPSNYKVLFLQGELPVLFKAAEAEGQPQQQQQQREQ